MVDLPAPNIVYPEIVGRAFRIEADQEGAQYALFWGNEMLTGGVRVPFRVASPQDLMGATVHRNIGRLTLGMGLLRVTAPPTGLLENPVLFSNGRDFRRIESAAAKCNTPSSE